MNNDSLDALFTGLTGTSQKPKHSEVLTNPQRTARKKKPRVLEEERFCTIVSSVLLHKIRLIASREGLQIKDVVNAAFEKAIKSYERKHGVIEGDIKGNVGNLF